MRRVAAATVLAIMGFAAVTSSAAAADPAPIIGLGDGCSDNQAFIVLAVDGPANTPYDIYVDQQLVADDRELGDGNLQYDVSDGMHYISMFTGDGNTLVDEAYYLVSCGEPVVDIAAACDEGAGAVHVNLASGSTKGTFDLYVDDQLVESDINTAPFGELYSSFLDGTHDVGIKWSGQDEGYLFDEEVTIECNDDDSGTPLPDSGGNTTPLLLAAGFLVAAGLGLLGLRRRIA